MTVVIHAHQLELPRGLNAFVRKHVTRPLERIYDNPAAELTIKLGDVRQKTGGVDQVCGMTLRLPRARTIHVHSIQDDVRTAVLDCADRIKRLVQRQVEKQRTPSRRPMRRPLGRTYREVARSRGVTLDGSPATL